MREGDDGTTIVYADRFVPDDEKRCARETGEDAQAIRRAADGGVPGAASAR